MATDDSMEIFAAQDQSFSFGEDIEIGSDGGGDSLQVAEDTRMEDETHFDQLQSDVLIGDAVDLEQRDFDMVDELEEARVEDEDVTDAFDLSGEASTTFALPGDGQAEAQKVFEQKQTQVREDIRGENDNEPVPDSHSAENPPELSGPPIQDSSEIFLAEDNDHDNAEAAVEIPGQVPEADDEDFKSEHAEGDPHVSFSDFTRNTELHKDDNEHPERNLDLSDGTDDESSENPDVLTQEGDALVQESVESETTTKVQALDSHSKEGLASGASESGKFHNVAQDADAASPNDPSDDVSEQARASPYGERDGSKVLPSKDDTYAEAQNQSENEHASNPPLNDFPINGIHNVLVEYQGSKMSLFPPHVDHEFETYLLSDDSLASESLQALLESCRIVLGDSIEPGEEMVLKVPMLKLELSEASEEAASFTLKQILQVYLELCRNDEIESPGALRIALSTRLSFQKQMNYLRASVTEGKGYAEVERAAKEEVLENQDSRSSVFNTLAENLEQRNAVFEPDGGAKVEDVDNPNFQGSMAGDLQDFGGVSTPQEMFLGHDELELDFQSPDKAEKNMATAETGVKFISQGSPTGSRDNGVPLSPDHEDVTGSFENFDAALANDADILQETLVGANSLDNESGGNAYGFDQNGDFFHEEIENEVPEGEQDFPDIDEKKETTPDVLEQQQEGIVDGSDENREGEVRETNDSNSKNRDKDQTRSLDERTPPSTEYNDSSSSAVIGNSVIASEQPTEAVSRTGTTQNETRIKNVDGATSSDIAIPMVSDAANELPLPPLEDDIIYEEEEEEEEEELGSELGEVGQSNGVNGSRGSLPLETLKRVRDDEEVSEPYEDLNQAKRLRPESTGPS